MTARKRRTRLALWITAIAVLSMVLLVGALTVIRPWEEPPPRDPRITETDDGAVPRDRDLRITVETDDGAVPRERAALEVLVEGGRDERAWVDAVTADGGRLTSSRRVAGGERRSIRLPLTELGRRVFGTCAIDTDVQLRITQGDTSQVVPFDLQRDPVRCAPLRWAPPPLENPETIAVGDDTSIVRLEPGRDYRLELPDHKRNGGLQVYGGRNVVLIGGHLTVPASASTDQERKALAFGDQTGTIHVEGVLIDGSGGGEADGVSVRAPAAILQVQNSRIVGLRGTSDGTHADVLQPWGGVKELRIDRLSGSSHFQGLQIPEDEGAIGRADLRSVDLVALPEIDGGGHMLWLTHSDCRTYPSISSGSSSPLALSGVSRRPCGPKPEKRSSARRGQMRTGPHGPICRSREKSTQALRLGARSCPRSCPASIT